MSQFGKGPRVGRLNRKRKGTFWVSIEGTTKSEAIIARVDPIVNATERGWAVLEGHEHHFLATFHGHATDMISSFGHFKLCMGAAKTRVA